MVFRTQSMVTKSRCAGDVWHSANKINSKDLEKSIIPFRLLEETCTKSTCDLQRPFDTVIHDRQYIICIPALRHHRLGPEDHYLILSSDGLYQYFTNEEVVNHVEWFMSSCPDGDPAQHLVEEVLFRAAKKAGMDFHELLDIPQGDRRKYHDDVSVMVISLEGRIWRSQV